jgi:hypothetical protein
MLRRNGFQPWAKTYRSLQCSNFQRLPLLDHLGTDRHEPVKCFGGFEIGNKLDCVVDSAL